MRWLGAARQARYSSRPLAAVLHPEPDKAGEVDSEGISTVIYVFSGGFMDSERYEQVLTHFVIGENVTHVNSELHG